MRAVSGLKRESFPAHYELRELDSLTASHLPLEGYRKNPAFPSNVQERPYDTSEGHQQGVKDRAHAFDADEIVNTAVSAETGPSIITRDGIILGGNSRKMVLELLRDKMPEKYAAYIEAIRSEAASFGLDPEALDGFSHPVLVRVLEFSSTDKTPQELGRISGVLNKEAKTGQDKLTKGVGMAKALTTDTLHIFARGLSQHSGTLRDFLDSTFARNNIISALESDGVFDAQNRDQYLDMGQLTPEGKDMVEATLRGLVVPDSDLLQRMKRADANTLKTFDAALPHMALVKALGSDNVTNIARGSIRLLLDYAASKSAWAKQNKGEARKYGADFYLTQPSLLDDITALRSNVAIREIFRAIVEQTPREFAPKWKAIAKSYSDMLSMPRMPGIAVDPNYVEKAIEKVMAEHDGQQSRAPRSIQELRAKELAEAAQAEPLDPAEIKAAEEADAKEREEGNAPRLKVGPNAAGRGLTVEQAQAHADEIVEGWTGAPEVKVVQTEAELLDLIGAQKSEGADGVVSGAYHKGTVYVVAESATSVQDIAHTLAHEVLRHHGLRLALGDAYERTMTQAWSNPAVQAKAIELGKQGYGWTEQELAESESLRIQAADEAIAHLGDAGVKGAWYDRALQAVQKWLRKIGLLKHFTNSDVRTLITGAESAAKNGAAASETGRHEATAPQFRRTSEVNEDRQTGEEALRAGIPHVNDKKGQRDFISTLKRMAQNSKSDEAKRMSSLAKHMQQAWWSAKTFPIIRDLLQAQTDGEEGRHAGLHEVMDGTVKAIKGLDKKAMGQLTSIIHQLDGKNLKGVTVSKFLGKKMEDGRTHWKLNEEHYTQLKSVLAGEGVAADVADAYVAIRRGLDTSLVHTFHKMQELRVDANLIDRFRSHIGHIQNYFPHMRFGDHYINVRDEAGETIYNEHVVAGLKKFRLAERQLAVEKMFPEAKAAKRITSGEISDMPESVFENGINTANIAQIIEQALDKSDMASSDVKEKVRREISKQVADVLLERGWGQHAMKRKNVAGYEKQDIGRVLAAYHSGHQGWLHKVEKAQRFAQIISTMKAKADPKLYDWAKQFSRDMLRNQDATDRMVAKARTAMSVWYIGGRISTAFTNLTQNLVLGIPTLSQHIGLGRAATTYMQHAVRSVAYMMSGEKGRAAHMRAGELAFLEDFHQRGITEANFMHEIAGLDGDAIDINTRSLVRTLFIPFTIAERFNRVSMALAAYRAARDGKIVNKKTMAKYGKKPGERLGEMDARDFAREVVLDSHFLTGKANLPGAVRGSLRAGLTPAYTFRGYQHGLISAWRHMLTGQGWAGKRAFAYSLAATMVVGGLKAMPMFALLTAAMTGLGGDDWDRDLYKGLRNILGDTGADMSMYGVGALGDITLAPSMGMDLPILSELRTDKPIGEQVMQKALGAVLGVPIAMVEQGFRAAHFFNLGNTYRGMETLAPAFVAAPIRAYRFATEGATSASGRPQAVPGTREQYKMDAGEAVKQSLGFTPLAKQKMYDAQSSVQRMEEQRKATQEKLVARYSKAKASGSLDALDEVLADQRAYNTKMREGGHPSMVIQHLAKLAREHSKIQKPSKRTRGELRDANSAYMGS